MTLIRIEPGEMEIGSNELQVQAAVVGETLPGLRAQCANCCLPPAVASQVDATLATLEPALRDIQVELLLEATILAVRGIMAVKGSAYAGELEMPLVTAPGISLLTGGSVAAAGTFSGTGGSGSIGGFATTGGSVGTGDYQVPVGQLDFGDIPSSGSNPVGRAYNPMSNSEYYNSSISSEDHIPINQDPNPGHLDFEINDGDTSTQPEDG